MTATEFQGALVEEIERLLQDVRTKNTAGKEIVGVKGYRQQLPVVMEDEDDTSKYFPYFIVRLTNGETKDDDDPWLVTADIIFGVCDVAQEAQGHLHILTMIQRVTDRFMAEPLLDHKYRASQEVSWALQEEEDTYPFYFGGLEMRFYIPKMGRRDEWS